MWFCQRCYCPYFSLLFDIILSARQMVDLLEGFSSSSLFSRGESQCFPPVWWYLKVYLRLSCCVTKLKINWICVWRRFDSSFSPSLSRPVRTEMFPAHCRQELRPAGSCSSFGSKSSSKRSKRDISLLPPSLFARAEIPHWPALRLCPSSEFSKSSFQTAPADFRIPLAHIEITFSFTGPWKIDELALM